MSANVTTITPFLTVKDGRKAIDFYIAAFGAVAMEKHEAPNGNLNAKMIIEGAAFYVGDEEPAFGNLSPAPNLNGPVRIILNTKNADTIFEQALKGGALEMCPMTTEDDWRIGKLRDPFGHVWEIGYML